MVTGCLHLTDKVRKIAGRMASSPTSFLLFKDIDLETVRQGASFPFQLYVLLSQCTQFLNAGLHLV